MRIQAMGCVRAAIWRRRWIASVQFAIAYGFEFGEEACDVVFVKSGVGAGEQDSFPVRPVLRALREEVALPSGCAGRG